MNFSHCRDAAVLCVVGVTTLASAQPVIRAVTPWQNVPALSRPGDVYRNPVRLNSNGQVLVGTSVTAANAAYRQFGSSPIEPLGTLPGHSASYAFGASDNGGVVVGASGSGGLDIEGSRAFYRTPSLGMVDMGVLPGADTSSARGVSADGAVIVGNSRAPRGSMTGTVMAQVGWRWTQATGMQELGGSSSFNAGYVSDVSGNGRYTVGTLISSESDIQGTGAVRWDGTAALRLTLPGNPARSHALATNMNGTTVVGFVTNVFGTNIRGFVWNESTGAVVLGTLYTGGYVEAVRSIAIDISDDGEFVVGTSDDGTGFNFIPTAFLWTRTGGMVSLHSYLTALGTDLTGWQLQSANSISGDGRTIAGIGVYQGVTMSFVVSNIPSPSAAFLGAVGIAAATRRRRT